MSYVNTLARVCMFLWAMLMPRVTVGGFVRSVLLLVQLKNNAEQQTSLVCCRSRFKMKWLFPRKEDARLCKCLHAPRQQQQLGQAGRCPQVEHAPAVTMTPAGGGCHRTWAPRGLADWSL